MELWGASLRVPEPPVHQAVFGQSACLRLSAAQAGSAEAGSCSASGSDIMERADQRLDLLLTGFAPSVIGASGKPGRRRAGTARVVEILAAASDWMRRALSDSGLQAMFYRFAEARQQLSVVLGRLRGYHQPWFLGFWASGPWPLLAPSDPYFLQAARAPEEIRLRVMISKLEAERAQADAAAPAAVAGRHTDTQTHRHTDTQTHRHTDTQTHRHTDTQTHRHTDTQTHRHTDTQTHRHTDTQTHRHTDTQTHRHTDTQTHRHTDTQTHRHTDTQTHRHTDTQTHRHTDTQTHRHTDTQPCQFALPTLRCRDDEVLGQGRGRLYDNVTQTVGDTPCIRISKAICPTGRTIYAKLEYFNPLSSVKDRLACGVIEDAERRGLLKPGDTVIEATSGNTGIALAMVCAQRGYKCGSVADVGCPPEEEEGVEVTELTEDNSDGEVAWGYDHTVQHDGGTRGTAKLDHLNQMRRAYDSSTAGVE
ncbi:Cysteine synthase [Symbiodinium microadriaticum]|uniref:Cysteine synthase n=1 Tax=Symbiodinium microadriaticum TaxID=2951 RepID=A0A1Q9EQ20_SYMMI|nr:Cysteine synthase [Symbiodinium microadriaticum]